MPDPHIDSPGTRGGRLLTAIAPLWIAALVLALYPYTENPAEPIKLLLSAWALALLTLGMLVQGLRKSWSVPAHGLLLVLVSWMLFQYALLAGSGSPRGAFATLAPWSIFTLIGLALYAFAMNPMLRRTPESVFDRLFFAYCYAVALASLYGFAQYFGFDPFPWGMTAVEEYRALPATYGNPNFAGHAMIVSMVLLAAALAYAWKQRRVSLVLATLLPLGVQAVHLWLTHMRSGWLALAAAAFTALLCVALGRLRWTPLKKTIALCAVLVLCAVIGFVLALAAFDRVAQIGDTSLLLRLNGYANALAMIATHPFLGWGANAFGVNTPAFWTSFEADWFALAGKRNLHVHNELLEFAVEGGLAGLFLFLTLVSAALCTAFHTAFAGGPGAWRSRALGLALVAYLADGLFGFNLHVPVSGALFFLLIAGIAACNNDRHRQRGLPVMLYGTALLVFAFPLAWFATHTFNAERRFQAGQGALVHARNLAASGDAAGASRLAGIAEQLLLRAQSAQPWDSRMAAQLGKLAQDTRNWDSAIAWYEEARRSDPLEPTLITQRAQCMIARDAAANSVANLHAAETLLDEVETRSPKLAALHALRGQMAALRARQASDDAKPHWQAAAEAYDKAMRNSPTPQPEWTTALAEASFESGDHKTLQRALNCAVEQAVFNPVLWALMQRIGDDPDLRTMAVDLVLTALGQTLRDDVQDRPAIWFQARTQCLPVMAGLLAEYGREASVNPEAQIALLTGALKLQPDALELWGAVAAAQHGGEDLRQVFLDLESTLSAPDAGNNALPPLVKSLAAALRRPEDCAAFLNLLDRSLDRLPQSDRYRANRQRWGWLLPFLPILANSPNAEEENQLRIQVMEGALHTACGTWEAGIVKLSPIVDSLPAQWQGMANYDLARGLEGAGRLLEALTALENARRRLPSAMEVQWYQAHLQQASGNHTAAAFELKRLIPRLSVDTPLYLHARATYCAALAALGQTDEIGVCP